MFTIVITKKNILVMIHTLGADQSYYYSVHILVLKLLNSH